MYGIQRVGRGDFFRHPANQQHTAHHHCDDVVIHYPFHPRCGERIPAVDQFLDQQVDDVGQLDLCPGFRRREFSRPRRLARIERPDVESAAQQLPATDAGAGHVVPRDRRLGQDRGLAGIL
jgi:hypothetical protein